MSLEMRAISLTSSAFSNLTVLMALNGEPAWICLLCCQLDSESNPPLSPALDPRFRIPFASRSSTDQISPLNQVAFSAIVVHWVTSKDKTTPATAYVLSAHAKGGASHYQNKSVNGTVTAGASSAKPSQTGGGKRNSSTDTKVLFVKAGCAHQCSPAAGCYYNNGSGSGASDKSHADATPGFGSTTIVTEHPVQSTRTESPSKLSEFSKYGSCFADEIEHIEMGHWDAENHSIEQDHRSDEDDEIKLVYRSPST